MDNLFIYNLVRFILNEDESGNAITPDNFSDLMQVCSLELTRQAFKLYEEGQELTDAIERFKDDEDLTFTSGEAGLPADYYRKSFMLAGGKWVDFVSDYEFGYRPTKYLTAPSADHPIARLAGGNVEILPNTITAATLYYLRRPNEPFFDYYYDSDGRMVYFPAADSPHTLGAGEIGREGQAATTEITSSDVELDWNDNEKLIIVGMICSKAGANLKEGQVMEYAELYKQQQA